MLEGDGFAVWCDADGNARLVTDAPPRVEVPLPGSAFRRHMFLIRAIRTHPRTQEWAEAMGPTYAYHILAAATLPKDVPTALAQALRDMPPGVQRDSLLAISKRLVAAKVPLRAGGWLPLPYDLQPAGRQALAEAVAASTQPSTAPATAPAE
jgi:hypothetical protein